MMKKKWVTDANKIEINRLGDLTFRNGIVDSYLDSVDAYFLSANKGMGKTLLLTYKRYLIGKSFEDRNRNNQAVNKVKFVPEDSPYLDTMKDISSISKDKKSFLSDINNCRDLWSYCLKISISLSVFGVKKLLGNERLTNKPLIGLLELFSNRPHFRTTTFFSEVLKLQYKEVISLLGDDEIVDGLYQSISSGVYVFIDKIDQSISQLPREAWINIQAGLIEASWNVMELNHHVKIYTSIRQEAFRNYNSTQKENIENFVKNIKYGEKDLLQIINKLTKNYEDIESFKEFVGFDTIINGGGRIEEDAFSYMLRHTTSRPRELVSIISGLSDQIADMDNKLFKEIIVEKAGLLVPQRFTEAAPFLNCLDSDEKRQRFLSLIPHNVLTRDEAIEICCQFNGVDKPYFDGLDAPRNEVEHPFCDLYSCGLLGYVDTDADNNPVVYFKQPKDMLNFYPVLMPNTALYFIHPALEHLIKSVNVDTYSTFNYVVVGHNRPWDNMMVGAYKIQYELINISNERFRKNTYRFLDLAVLEQESDLSMKELYERLDTYDHGSPSDAQKAVLFYMQEYFDMDLA